MLLYLYIKTIASHIKITYEKHVKTKLGELKFMLEYYLLLLSKQN